VFRGDRLRQIREARKLTQDELGESLGFSHAQINRYENGKADPTPDVLVRLSKELQVTTDYFLGLVDSPSSHLEEQELSPTERKLLSAHRRGDLKELMRIAGEQTS
jgi:transcriptional regulator with XRE-family HTH domain